MKPVGLIQSSDRGESSMSQAGAGSASSALRLTLDEALARAVATNALGRTDTLAAARPAQTRNIGSYELAEKRANQVAVGHRRHHAFT
jgi:hypothetical protein